MPATVEPLLTREGDRWTPSAHAKGPFPGLHGGPSIAAMTMAMEERARAAGAGDALSLHAHLLRRVELAPFRVVTDAERVGGRVALIGARLIQDEKVCFLGRLTCAKPLALPGYAAEPARRPARPEDLPALEFRPRQVAGSWMGDVCDFRRGDDGIVWVRLLAPLAGERSPFAYVAALADWSTGPNHPEPPEHRTVGMWPNVDFTLQIARPPVLAPGREWIGLEGDPHWYPDGRGFTATRVHDVEGPFAQVGQAVILFPLEDARSQAPRQAPS